jgi:hypothetical protein
VCDVRFSIAHTFLTLVFSFCFNTTDARDTMQSAAVMVGPHGGAFANAFFAPPGAHVVEIVPSCQMQRHRYVGRKRARKQKPRVMFWGLAHCLRQPYHLSEPANFGFYSPGMVVNVTDVMSILADVGVVRDGWQDALVAMQKERRR